MARHLRNGWPLAGRETVVVRRSFVGQLSKLTVLRRSTFQVDLYSANLKPCLRTSRSPTWKVGRRQLSKLTDIARIQNPVYAGRAHQLGKDGPKKLTPDCTAELRVARIRGWRGFLATGRLVHCQAPPLVVLACMAKPTHATLRRRFSLLIRGTDVMKRLLICLDGTWNESGQEETGSDTNVAKLFRNAQKYDGAS